MAKLLAGLERVVVVDGDDLVVDLRIEHLGDKARADALDLVRPCHACGQNRRCLGLHGHDLHVRILGFQEFSRAGNGTAGADACDENIDLAVSVGPDLGAGRLKMRLGVRGVHKLAGDKAVRNFLCKLVCLRDRALHALCALGKHQLRAVGLHQLAALDGHGLGHDDNNAVSARGSDGGKTDARVAGGRLNDDRALLQKTLLLCVVNHRLGDAVFDRARGIEVFKLGEDGGLETIGLFQMREL